MKVFTKAGQRVSKKPRDGRCRIRSAGLPGYPAHAFSGSRFLLVILMLLCLQSIFAVTGRIIDAEGKAIAGATVTDKRGTTSSDEDGRFNLESKADSLYVSRIGFHRLAVHAGNLRSPIVLQRDDIVMPTVWVRAVEYRAVSPALNARIIYPDTNAQAQSANELLLQNSSFSTTDIPLAGERQTVSLLGSFSRHSLVMLDGVVLNASGEAFDFSKIPYGQIGSIEIIKGSASVYGGSSAIGGIIHIHSKDAARKALWEGSIATTLGSFGLNKQAYSAYFRQKYLSLNVEYTHHAAQNDFSYDTPEFWGIEPQLLRLHNRKVADSFYAKGSYIQGGTQVDYSINAGSFVRQLPGPIHFLDLYDASRMTGTYSQQSLRGIHTHKALAHELLLWWNSDRSSYVNLESTNPIASSHYRQKQVSRGLKTSSNLNLNNTKLGLNAEYGEVDFDFTNILNASQTSGNRANTALALRAQQDFFPMFCDYKVAGAIRGDFSDARLHPTWRLEQELKFPLATELVLGGNLGTAFSQPSLFDMYWIGDSETQGNPDLASESSFGYDIFASLTFSGGKLRAAFFRNWVENLIQWRQYYLNGVSWKPFNVGSADLQNIELEADVTLHKALSLNCGITFTKAYDLSLNPDGTPSPTYHKKLVYTPEVKALLNLAYGDAMKGVALRYNYTGVQYSTPDNLIEPLAAFDTIDGSAYYSIAWGKLALRLDLKANNILDKRYDIYAYIPQPGFNWTAGITLSANSNGESTLK